MASYVQVLYQIIFATKYRRRVLTKPNRVHLYKYIHGICTKRKCILYEINGVEDHTHLIIRIHPSIAIADLVKEVKAASSRHIKEEGLFPGFECWQPGYSAFSYAPSALPNLRRYVRRQEVHHAAEGSKAELERLLRERGVDYDPRYLE
jgi:REP element-mobilizing transposase RayT